MMGTNRENTVEHTGSKTATRRGLSIGRLGRVAPLAPRRRGSALVMVTVFTAIVASTVSYVMMASNRQTRNTFRARLMDTSLSAAATMVKNMSEQAYFMATTRPAQMGGDWSNLNDTIKAIKPQSLPGYVAVKSGGKTLTFMADAPGNGDYSKITEPSDDWYGFNIRRWTFDAVSFMNAADPDKKTKTDPVAVRLGFEGAGFRSQVQVNYIPLYHYAIFYDNDLEFHPGPAMTVSGPVHTNRNLWLAAGNSLTMKSRVTAAGNLRNYRDFDKSVSGTNVAAVNYTKSDGKIWQPESGTHGGGVYVQKGEASNTKVSIADYNSGIAGDTNGNKFLDSLDTNWMQKALERFSGQVTDKAMGERKVQPPLPFIGTGKDRQQADASQLIQRVDWSNPNSDLERAKIEMKADIRITANPSDFDSKTNVPKDLKIEVANKDANGNVTGYSSTVLPNQLKDKWGNLTGEPIVTVGEFTDYRENRPVKTLDINMDAILKRSDVSDKVKQGNGVIYVSTNSNVDPAYNPDNPKSREKYNMNAVRILNAQAVPSKSGDDTLTLATDRPMYMVGNVNTGTKEKGKSTLLLAADALTVLSKKLDASTGRNSAASGAVETNAIFMIGEVSSKFQTADKNGKLTGNAATNTIDHYEDGYKRKQWSGGVHNVIRYLEGWGGKKHTFNGSLICLFESQVATARHQTDGDSSYYGAPDRSYNWDASLKDKVPPAGMPVLVQVRMSPLERISLAEAVQLASGQ